MFIGGISLAIWLLTHQSYPENSPRTLAHRETAELLSQTNFFLDGRGMTLSPDFVNTYEFMAWIFGLSRPIPAKSNLFARPLLPFQDRWGIIDNGKNLQGFFNIDYRQMNIGAIGCVACHSGKAAGIFIPGLGNKNIDAGQIGKDGYRFLKLWKRLHIVANRSNEYREIEERSIDFNRRLANPETNNLTQGLVPVAVIQEWFYKQAGTELPKNHGRGQVKVPHFWGYGEKRFSGQFADGFGNGERPGWGLLVELVGGQSVEGARKLMPKVSLIEEKLSDLLPPIYPFEIDRKRAIKGKSIFDSTCAACHGTYERDDDGFPIYKAPKHIPLRIVKTDSERLDIITEEFLSMVEKNPLSDDIQIHRREPGYFAPRLEGIWSRFPYLHNASVPNIGALLTRPEDRPTRWSLKDAGERDRFDKVNLGLRTEAINATSARHVYEIRRPGHSNQGHWFSFSDTFSDDDKANLIEYLKTL